ncbi:MAG: methyl-accepting chemotaxis protein, partial [bacterium]
DSSVQSQEMTKRLQQRFEKFSSYKDLMLELAVSRLKNETALTYASTSINPESISVLGALTNMIGAEEEEEVSPERREWLNFMHDFRFYFSKLMTSLRLYLNEPSLDVKKNLLNSFSVIQGYAEKINHYEELYSFEQEDSVQSVLAGIELIEKNIQEMMKISESNKRRLDIYYLNEEISPLMASMKSDIDSLVRSKTGQMEKSSQKLLGSVSSSIQAQTTLAGIGLLLSILVVYTINKMITHPLDMTVKALEEAAAGDGDLSRRLEVKSKDELGHLAMAFNRFTIKLQKLMQEVNGGSKELILSADKMNGIVAAAESDIHAQKNQIDQISVAVNSMVEKVQKVTDNTNLAADLADQTHQNSIKGNEVVHQSLQSSQALSQDVDQAANVINELQSEVEAISSVVDVIGSIAEQTNLLALNAAIEAARAGEQGRGFAVVADEVRTLASRTQESTQEIQDMIQRLQAGSLSAVDVMKNAKLKANDGLEQARSAGQSLEKITQAVEGMLKQNKEIANSSREQGENALKVSQNISTINQLSSQTAENSTVMAATGNQVNALALKLQDLMSQFKV